MLVSMREILDRAKLLKYGVGAFNVSSMLYVDAILDAAEVEKSPVIVAISEGHIQKGFINIEEASAYIIKRAKKLFAPIALHLDHGESMGMVRSALDNGFTSVMIDKSHEDFTTNILKTKAVVDLCLPRGVPVEGELGIVGGKEGDPFVGDIRPEYLTSPDAALTYIQQTGVYSLAVSIGNVHGKYKGEANFDFECLKKIAKNIDSPLVLHGGSGISDKNFQKLIAYGISKINFYSGNTPVLLQSFHEYLSSTPETKDVGFLFQSARKALVQNITQKMRIFGSSGKS